MLGIADTHLPPRDNRCMGLYDREYLRDDDQPMRPPLRAPKSAVTTLLLINAAVYVLELFLNHPNGGNVLVQYFAMSATSLYQPWMWWQSLTSGFLHDPRDLFHVIFNMFGLWVFGRDIEERYGKFEFLRFYLFAIVISAFGWAAAAFFLEQWITGLRCLGASGGVAAVLILWVLHYPHRTILLMFIIPCPAWLVGVLYLAGGLWGAFMVDSDTAHTAHLAGVLFAAGYYRWRGRELTAQRSLGAGYDQGYRGGYGGYGQPEFPTAYDRFDDDPPARQTSRPTGWWGKLRSLFPGGGPRLKLHTPDEETSLEAEADRVLDKIKREGKDSLTRKERRILEEYSRRLQGKDS
jgi:membrane associated rhomboid family serine protease